LDKAWRSISPSIMVRMGLAMRDCWQDWRFYPDNSRSLH
jgi:hypothetical protein